MERHLYLRPVGLYHAATQSVEERQDQAYIQAFSGLELCGGPLSFSSVEVCERGPGGKALRRVVALSELFDRDWGRHTLAASDLIEALRQPRPRLSGLSLGRPRIMGIVNVTPDSFSDGGKWFDASTAIEHALQLAEEGADILDIGGESTRPGSDAVPLDQELKRVLPVLEGLRPRTDKLISIDTRKAEVMRQAAAAGADILNDVSALTHDPDALDAAGETGLPVMLMHAQGDPKTMNDNPQYSDVVLDVFDFLEQRVKACEAAGISKAKLIVDPGIGFGKHLAHNVAVLSALSLYHGLGVPVLLGASRKKLIGQLCNVDDPEQRVPGSLAAALLAASQGVQLIRVHDVAATRQALSVWEAVNAGTEAAVAERRIG